MAKRKYITFGDLRKLEVSGKLTGYVCFVCNHCLCEFSADPADYFSCPDNEKVNCCEGESVSLVRKVTKYEYIVATDLP